MDVVVQPETAKIAGTRDTFWDEKDVGSGVLQFSSNNGGKAKKIGLCMAIVERMKWEQERGGYVGGTGNVRMVRVEEFEGNGMWRKFGCYLLVETFVLNTKDGMLVLTYDYNHTHQVRCKWEWHLLHSYILYMIYYRCFIIIKMPKKMFLVIEFVITLHLYCKKLL